MDETILIVDDEEDILDLVEYTLLKEGYEVITCKDTKNVRDILDEEDVSLIIMDRNLPGVEGSEFIKQIKQEGYNYPVIYLSAKDKSEDILDGFERGGDDYITKPFDLNILKARVKAVLKRVKGDVEIQKEGDILYDATKKKFFIEKEEVPLTKLEHDLLLVLIKHKETLLSREFLLQEVWEDYENRQTKTVNVAIKRLKEKIDPQNTKEYIQSVRGEGYIFSTQSR
ncbi:MAG: response regulator transcription factor [Epsilonproteobacteria bacterium]|nr:response regulator transcription factor [Campylobacterota bacterium]